MKNIVDKINKVFLAGGAATVALVFSWIAPWLGMMFVVYVLLPNPPKPEITYGEFPYRLEYEFDGETYVVEDSYICEFSGFEFTTATGKKYRVWEGSHKSGNDRITLGKKDSLEYYCFEVWKGHSSRAGAYMGDPELEEAYTQESPAVIYTNNYAKRHNREGNWDVFDKVIEEEELINHGIRIISWEIAPPIVNTFKPTLYQKILSIFGVEL